MPDLTCFSRVKCVFSFLLSNTQIKRYLLLFEHNQQMGSQCVMNNKGRILGFEVSAFDSLVVAVMDI
jgi:hypothetical protein